MYSSCLTQESLQIFCPQWNFGDMYFTSEAEAKIDAGANIISMVIRINQGDYGLISADEIDQRRTTIARDSGRRFVAVFEEPQGVFYIALNEFGRTIVCMFDER